MPPRPEPPAELPEGIGFASLDALPMQAAVLAADGEIRHTNRAWREFARENDVRGDPGMVGENYLAICDAEAGVSEDAATVSEGLRAVLDGDRESFAHEYPCHSPNEQRWFLMRATRFDHVGEHYLLVVHLDITERRLAELEAVERADRLEKVARLLSHDIRNPLSVARGYADLLAPGEHADGAAGDDVVPSAEAPPSDDEVLDRVRSALDRIETILGDGLVLAREQTETDSEAVDLRTAVEAAWRNVDTAGATLAVESTLRFEADPELLAHVLENLVRNAADHGGPDVTVRVGALAPSRDGNPPGFYVEDDGEGIPADVRDRVFDATYTTGGNGLGLTIVADVVEAHDWAVEVTASADGGARFEITGVEPASAA